MKITLDGINSALKSGKTVYIQTAFRTTRVTARDVAKFTARNRELFRAHGGSLYMSVGNRYDCIDYCKITFAG